MEVCHHHPALVLKTATVPHWSGADLVTHTKDIPEKFSKKCVRSVLLTHELNCITHSHTNTGTVESSYRVANGARPRATHSNHFTL